MAPVMSHESARESLQQAVEGTHGVQARRAERRTARGTEGDESCEEGEEQEGPILASDRATHGPWAITIFGSGSTDWLIIIGNTDGTARIFLGTAA